MKHISVITATIKLSTLINSGQKTKVQLSEEIGIGRSTLDIRLKRNNWKKGELEIIKSM